MNWKSLGEQIAHFLLFGFIAYLGVEASVVLLCYREFSRWWAPWPFKGQWPPKDYRPDRVEDLRLDVVVSLAGIVAGSLAGGMMG